MKAETVISCLSMLGEWAIAFVIWYELERGALDKYLDETYSREDSDSRMVIYEAYCGLKQGNRARNIDFKDTLAGNKGLRLVCHQQVVLFDKLATRLPFFRPLRRRIIQSASHVVVFLWEMLYPYIQERRTAAGSDWARPFLKLVRESLEYLLDQNDPLVILDPQPSRGEHVHISVERLREMKAEIHTGLKRTD